MHLSIKDRPSEEQGIRVIHAALEAGVTLIDTADVYCLDDSEIGHNERLIAKALRTFGQSRDQIIVATKGGMQRPGGRWEMAVQRILAISHLTLSRLSVRFA